MSMFNTNSWHRPETQNAVKNIDFSVGILGDLVDHTGSAKPQVPVVGQNRARTIGIRTVVDYQLGGVSYGFSTLPDGGSRTLLGVLKGIFAQAGVEAIDRIFNPKNQWYLVLTQYELIQDEEYKDL